LRSQVSAIAVAGAERYSRALWTKRRMKRC
jgi:hypothetical protein